MKSWKKNIKNRIYEVICSISDPDYQDLFFQFINMEELITKIYDDLVFFAEKDPASKNNPTNIFYNYSSFVAVFNYRVANAMLYCEPLNAWNAEINYQYALFVSCKAKMVSGIEIHPCAKIGNKFVIDHGFGVVIGETTEIGDRCYVLGGVILGAFGIAGNPNNKRHPTIGNDVQIGSFSRIFGNINIGNNVIIGANCTIKSDIDDNCVVTLKSELQIIKNNNKDND